MTTLNSLLISWQVGHTFAFDKVKKLLRSSFSNSMSEQMHLEGESIVACGGTQDAQNAIACFLNKQKPNFSGE